LNNHSRHRALDRSNLQQDPSTSSRLRTCHLYGAGASTVRQTSFTGLGVLRIGSRATPFFVSPTGALAPYHFFDCAVRKVARGE
jgi:hypothetical protein